MSKQFLFKQFTSASHSLLLFDPKIGSCQVQPLRGRVYLGLIALKAYSTFPKIPALLVLHNQIFHCHISMTLIWMGVLPLCRKAVGIFDSPS